MNRCQALLWVAVVLVGFAANASARDEPAVAPPGPDETLIYVVRPGRMLGAAVGHWIAINDKTVARLRSDKHAIIRHPAGYLTLNMANSGVPIAVAAVDNRRGETVYLKWRMGDDNLSEVDEATAQKLIRKTKRMDPIDEIVPNAEQMMVLMNLSRMGFDVMEPDNDPPRPDSEHAVITVFRQKEGDKFDFGLWNGDGFVGTLRANEAISIKVPPGTHFFMAGNVGYTQMKAEVAAGKHYYAWLDYGKMMGRVRLTPVAASESRSLDKWLKKVSHVRLGAAADSDRIAARERVVIDYIEGIEERAARGDVDYNLLGPDNAF